MEKSFDDILDKIRARETEARWNDVRNSFNNKAALYRRTVSEDSPGYSCEILNESFPPTVTLSRLSPTYSSMWEYDSKPLHNVTTNNFRSLHDVTANNFRSLHDVTVNKFRSLHDVTANNFRPLHDVTANNFRPLHDVTTNNFRPLHDVTTNNFRPMHDVTSINFRPLHDVTTRNFGPLHDVTANNFRPLHDVTARNFGPLHDVTANNFRPLHDVTARNFPGRNCKCNNCTGFDRRLGDHGKTPTEMGKLAALLRKGRSHSFENQRRNDYCNAWHKPSLYNAMPMPESRYAIKSPYLRSLLQAPPNVSLSPRVSKMCPNFTQMPSVSQSLPIQRARSEASISQGNLREEQPSIDTTLKLASNFSDLINTTAGVEYILTQCLAPENQLQFGDLPEDLADVDLSLARSLSTSDIPREIPPSKPPKLKSLTDEIFILTCAGCGKSFGGGEELEKHVKDFPIHLLFRCEVCEKGFANGALLVRHKAEHEGFPFEDLTNSDSHINRSPSTPGVPRKTSRSKRKLKPLTDDSLILTCAGCAKSFEDGEELEDHVQKFSWHVMYRCQVCEKGFANGTLLLRHKAEHKGGTCSQDVHKTFDDRRQPLLQ